MNIVRHMELTIMQDDKEEHEQQATEELSEDRIVFQRICETHEQLGMN